MSGQGYQTLLDCRRRSRLLRERGFTIDQIAIVLSLDHQVNPLRLYRYAAGLTARQVVTATPASTSPEQLCAKIVCTTTSAGPILAAVHQHTRSASSPASTTPRLLASYRPRS